MRNARVGRSPYCSSQNLECSRSARVRHDRLGDGGEKPGRCLSTSTRATNPADWTGLHQSRPRHREHPGYEEMELEGRMDSQRETGRDVTCPAVGEKSGFHRHHRLTGHIISALAVAIGDSHGGNLRS